MIEPRVTKYVNIRTRGFRILPDRNPGYYKPNDIETITDYRWLKNDSKYGRLV